MNLKDIKPSNFVKAVFDRERNKLTEYIGNYKRINPSILACYTGLQDIYSKISLAILAAIMRDKVYGEEREGERDINESKRIYNYSEVTIEEILMDLYSIKYADKNVIASDRSNLIKRIHKLVESNIFYVWKYNDMYMYVLEREIGSWKDYNLFGYVTPKTLKKIVACSEDMLYTMIKMLERKKANIDRPKIEKSFGRFINTIICKMNPSLLRSVVPWDEKQYIHDYLRQVALRLEPIDDFAGMVCDDKFLLRLPHSVSSKLINRLPKEKNTMRKDSTDTEKAYEAELLPKNPIISKRTRTRTKNNPAITVSEQVAGSSKPEPTAFDQDPEPFKDSKTFVSYYRACITQFSQGRVRFEPFEVDAHDAASIMDTLVEKRRYGDKNFLTAWFRYFYDNKLKGEKAMKTKYTSLKEVLLTLNQFDPIYFLDAE